MRPMRRIPGGRVIDLGGEEGYYPDIYNHHERKMRELERREEELEERERRLEHAERMHRDGLENAPWRRKTLAIHTKSNTAEVLEGRVVGVAATEEQTQIVQHTINISILMDITSPKSLPSLPLKRWKM